MPLFTKLIWRILNQPECLWVKTLKALYIPNCSFLKATINYKCFKFWRNIIKIKNETIHLWCWYLSEPHTINIWEDPRIQSLYFKKPHDLKPADSNFTFVADLLNPNSNTWNIEALFSIFTEPIVNEVRNIKLPLSVSKNKIIWNPDKNDMFTVKSTYNYFAAQIYPILKTGFDFWKYIWLLKCPKRVKFFLWKLAHGKLQTKSILFKNKITTNDTCPRCNRSVETNYHAIFFCENIRHLWFTSGCMMNPLKWNNSWFSIQNICEHL